MNQRDSRAKELDDLKLALAKFALRLDEFEARSRARSFKAAAQDDLNENVTRASKIVSAMKRRLYADQPKQE